MATAPLSPGLYDPKPDERSSATLAHALQIIGAWIAPLIVWLVKRDSRFVTFHALQALFLQIFIVVLMGIIFVVGIFGFMVPMIHQEAAGVKNPEPPLVFLVMFPLIWLVWMLVWISTIVLAIVYSIKASRGEWAAYPLIGRLVRHIMHLS